MNQKKYQTTVRDLTNHLSEFHRQPDADADQTLALGVRRRFTERGTGRALMPGDTVVVKYFGMLIGGKRFDDNLKGKKGLRYQHGTGQVIRGWEEGLRGARAGDELLLFLPAAAGYGSVGAGRAIPPNSDLLFWIEIMEVTG